MTHDTTATLIGEVHELRAENEALKAENERLQEERRLPGRFLPLSPRVPGRRSVRDPLVPYIVLPLLSFGEQPAEVHLTVGAALHLIAGLASALDQFCQRGDVQAVLSRTDNGTTAIPSVIR